ncbi:hypothetical protein CVT24_001444 [Panaeolus cyanescens]|uniref:Transmembrane protein n=1 Tax=Panaeolus cyanescens TaxID=181874 RepID=A0A409WXZ1_9AGAR|nr:hypothetical protein CVT24_001444 [Panaeolus cyanescens]
MSLQRYRLGSVLVLALGLVYVQAQDAVCLSDASHQWGYNSRGQSPCDVAGSLLSVCLGRSVTIVALDPGRIYSGSQPSGEGNTCRCSSVYYATLAACAQCQGRNWGTWEDQIENCDGDVSIMSIPISIPSGTLVPSWAYLDYPSVGTFDVDLARASISSSSSSSITSRGVVGGLAALGIIAGIIAFVIIKSKKDNPSNRPTSTYSEKPPPHGMGQVSPFMAPTSPNATGGGMNQASPFMAPTVNPATTGGSQYYNQAGGNPTPYTPPQTYPQYPNNSAQQSPFATPPHTSMGIPSQDGSSYAPQGPGAAYGQGGAYRGVPEV